MEFWFICKICAIIQEKWVFLWLWKVLFFISMGHNLLGKIIKSRKDHFKEPTLTSEKTWNIENMKVKIGLIWQCVLHIYQHCHYILMKLRLYALKTVIIFIVQLLQCFWITLFSYFCLIFFSLCPIIEISALFFKFVFYH